MNDCAICDKRLADGSKLVTLGEKGCEGIARISAACNDSIHIHIGQQVHTDCRRDYIRDGGRRKRKSTDDTHLSLRSDKAAFCYKEHCLYCENGDRYKGKIKHHVLIPARTIDFQDTVRKLFVDRADNWADTVLSRIAFVPDLHAADSMYHVSFRTGKQIPECFQSDSNSSTKRRRSGRPVVTDREEAFLIVADRFEANDEEVTTVHYLITQMKNILHNSESEPYGLTYMNGKLKEHFGDRIIITEINGKKNVVTFLQTAFSIVSDFHHHPKVTDPEAEKLRLIETAVKLIKTDIKTIVESRDVYPTTLEMASVEMPLAFLPVSLRHFLDCLFVGKDKDLKALRVSSIGQSIMQAARPRVLTAPLQLGLGVQMHSLFASRFLVDTLYRHGFCSSYSEIQKFERSAATQSGTDIPGYIPGHFIQYAADNVDHNIRTLDGSGTFHGMGIVANVTPKVDCASVIKRVSVTANDIAQVGKIDIRHYTAPTLGLKTLEYNTIVLPEIHSLEKILNVNLLWKTTFAVRPQRPAWSGFMQLISRGEHPGASSVRLLPMIDMDPGDLTCIYSTLCFVLDHSRRYNATPVITFDQPLWWKATSILENEREGSELKSIVVRLGGFHTLMSYLGCIGHLMKGSGLKKTMEQVFTRNTVTYIMSGKAVSRALRGPFLVDAALNTILLEDALDFKTEIKFQVKTC